MNTLLNCRIKIVYLDIMKEKRRSMEEEEEEEGRRTRRCNGLPLEP